MDALLLKVVNAVDHLPLTSAQAVKLRDHQLITRQQRLERCLKLGSLAVGRASADLLREDRRATCCFEFCRLRFQVLLCR